MDTSLRGQNPSEAVKPPRRREPRLGRSTTPFSLGDRLKALNGDVDFIRFLCERHFPVRRSEHFMTIGRAGSKDSARKKMKRYLQKVWGEQWREVWKRDYLPHMVQEVRIRIQRGVLWTEVTQAGVERRRRPGAPKHDAKWRLVWLLQEYFRRLTGRPCWPAVAAVVSEYTGAEYSYMDLESGWQKRKRDFEVWTGSGPVILWESTMPNMFLDSELNFYERCKQRGTQPHLPLDTPRGILDRSQLTPQWKDRSAMCTTADEDGRARSRRGGSSPAVPSTAKRPVAGSQRH